MTAQTKDRRLEWEGTPLADLTPEMRQRMKQAAEEGMQRIRSYPHGEAPWDRNLESGTDPD